MEKNARRPKPKRKRAPSPEGKGKPRAKKKPVQPFYDEELTQSAHKAFPMMKDAAKWAGLSGSETIVKSCLKRRVAGRDPATPEAQPQTQQDLRPRFSPEHAQFSPERPGPPRPQSRPGELREQRLEELRKKQKTSN